MYVCNYQDSKYSVFNYRSSQSALPMTVQQIQVRGKAPLGVVCHSTVLTVDLNASEAEEL